MKNFFFQKNPEQTSAFVIRCSLLALLLAGLFTVSAQAQFQHKEDLPSSRGALLRSLVLPGWGHHYVDKSDWRQGQYHLAADAVMILSYAGLSVRSNVLRNDLETYALSNAGAELNGRDREFFIAVGNFDNLEAYNDFQIRSRNWNNLITDSPENEWNWSSVEERARYQDMRERIDKNDNQLPTIITLMVANRVISGLSAFVKARNLWSDVPQASLSYLNEFGEPGVTARLKIHF